MNISRYQQLIQQRFGQPTAMATVSLPRLDAAMGRDESRRELSLGRAGMAKKGEGQSLKMANERLGLAGQEFAMRQGQYDDDMENMGRANWLNAGNAALGLGQGLVERQRYGQMASQLKAQEDFYRTMTEKMKQPPNAGLAGGYPKIWERW